MANERHTDFRQREQDSSTRQSVHAYTKYHPFSEATSTTAEILKTVAAGEIATNWVTNPRVEATDISMFTVTGSAISRSTAQQAVGTASLLVNPANSAAEEGVYWESPTLPFSVAPQYISAQCVVRGASAASAVKLEIRDAAGTTVLAASADTDLAADWDTQLTASIAIAGSTTAAAYRVYVVTTAQHNINFYLDKIMFEAREDTLGISTYVDGATGVNYEWTGTANASTSIKRPDMTVVKGIYVKNQSGTAADIVYVAFNTTATSTTGIPVRGGDEFYSNWPLDFDGYVSVIAAQNTPTISGVIWGTYG